MKKKVSWVNSPRSHLTCKARVPSANDSHSRSRGVRDANVVTGPSVISPPGFRDSGREESKQLGVKVVRLRLVTSPGSVSIPTDRISAR